MELRITCIHVALLFAVVFGYELQKVELPSDLSDVRIFTDEEIALYDGSDVRLYSVLFAFDRNILLFFT